MAESTAPKGQPGSVPSASPAAQGNTAAPAGIPQPAMAAAQQQGLVPGMPPVPPHVQAMMPRPYPNPEQMFRPVGMAAVMQMQMMQQQAAMQQQSANKGPGKK